MERNAARQLAPRSLMDRQVMDRQLMDRQVMGAERSAPAEAETRFPEDPDLEEPFPEETGIGPLAARRSEAMPLGAVPLEAVPLEAVPLAARRSEAMPLEAVQLGSAQQRGPAQQRSSSQRRGPAQQGHADERASSDQTQPADAEGTRSEQMHSEQMQWDANDMEQPIPLNVNAWRPNAADRRRGVPLATLEEPSSSRFDLTPSPVPRVSLAPATGSVDISLVPGPNSFGLRNLPTLAARHVLGRPRQRAAAARALTFPPTAALPAETVVERKLVTSVRSSKREIVLGLGIGIALSALLGVIGQSFLEPLDQPSLVIESTANALSPAVAAAPRMASLAASERAPQPGAAQTGPEERGAAEPADVSSNTAHESAADPSSAGEVVDAARTSAGAEVVASSKRRASARSSGSSKNRASAQRARDDVSAPRRDRPAPEGLPADRADRKPLSPSESAGLGLDLPF